MKEKLISHLNGQIVYNVRRAKECHDESNKEFYMARVSYIIDLLDKVEAGEFDE